jgi:hypothetical protein
MLLETASPATIVPLTPDPLESMPAGGTVTLFITVDKRVLLVGSGPSWYTEESTLYLAPEAKQPLPLCYDFIFEMGSPQYLLLGASVYPADAPEDANAALVYPVLADGTVKLNLKHNLPAGAKSVSYMLGIGYTDGTVTTWIPDPTITFSPQT